MDDRFESSSPEMYRDLIHFNTNGVSFVARKLLIRSWLAGVSVDDNEARK